MLGENALKFPILDLQKYRTPEQKTKSLLRYGGFCAVLLFAACLFFGMAGTKLAWADGVLKEVGQEVWTGRFKYLFFLTVFACIAYLLYCHHTGGLTDKRVIIVLMILVLAARLVYITEIGIRTNQHDTSNFFKEGNTGHTGYIQYLREYGIPEFDVTTSGQFYHPPLHHLVCGWFLDVQESFGIDFEIAIENLQILTLFYSMVTLYAAYRVLALLGFTGAPLYVPMVLLGFHPTFYLFSGSINNDCLSVMFAFLAVWAALEWYKKPSFLWIAWLGVCIGCSMFAKFATGVIAPAVAFMFLHRLISERGWKGRGVLIGQFALFGVICIPLGIGWQARNALVYDGPFFHVPRLSDEADQYLGGYSTWERFTDWDSLEDFGVYPMRTGTQGAEYFEHCIPLAVLKMSMFGEYSKWKDYHIYDAAGNTLFWVNVIVVIATLVGLAFCVWHFYRRKTEEDFVSAVGFGRMPCFFFIAYWVTMILSYIPFCFGFPHFCSMDFRYMVPTLLTGAVFLAVLLKYLDKKINPATVTGRLCAWAKAAIYTATALFAVCSTMIYPMYY